MKDMPNWVFISVDFPAWAYEFVSKKEMISSISASQLLFFMLICDEARKN